MENRISGTPPALSSRRLGAVFLRIDVRGTLLPCVLLLISIAAVYWPVSRFGFVNYDDPAFVVDNPQVRDGLTAKSLQWAFQSLYIYWQPLTWISYMADYEWHGLKAGGFHVTNVLLHGANTVVLFLAWKRMTGAVAGSAIIAALFALHPLHVETVAWIADRKTVLSGLFWMLALLAYVRYVEKPRPVAYALVVFCFALGLMSKSIVLTLPCALLLLDFWPLRRLRLFRDEKNAGRAGEPHFPEKGFRWLLWEKVPLLALVVLSSLVTIAAQKRMGAILSTEMISGPQRLAQSVVGYVLYLRKLFWPNDLAVFYPNQLHWPGWQVGLSALILAVVTLLALWEVRRRPYLLVGWLWFLGTLFPVSGLFQTGEQMMADRYSYLPLIGLFLMLTWGAADVLAGKKSGRAVLGGATVLVLLACGFLASRQVQTWRNTRTLFLHAKAVTQNNYLADTVLGRILVDEGKFDDAIPLFAAALKVQPYYASTHYGMADALAGKNALGPAIQHYREALRTDPANAFIRLRLAAACAAGGQWEEAALEYARVLESHPDSPSAELGLATVRQAQRRPAEALQHYRRSLQLLPSQPVALNNAAWILATHSDAKLRDGAEAVRLAERANELTGRKVAFVLGTLAAAYAEQGNFAAAIKTAEEARDTARASGQTEVAQRNVELLELYRAGKPCRDVP